MGKSIRQIWVKDYKVMGDVSVKQNLTSNYSEKVLIRTVMSFSYGCSEEIDHVTGTETLVEHFSEVWCSYTHNNLESWNKVKLFKLGVSPEREVQGQTRYQGGKVLVQGLKQFNTTVPSKQAHI